MTRLALCVAAVAALAPRAEYLAAASGILSAEYRKDIFLSQYIELGENDAPVPDPVDGGRLHVVGTATQSGVVASVVLNGTLLNMSLGIPLSAWTVDWVRVEPIRGLVAGAPFWLSLHSRLPAWDALRASGGSVTLVVLAADGSALVNGSFAVAVPPVRVTWVTTGANRSALHVFVHCGPGAGHTAARVRVDGRDVTALIPAQSLAVPANESVLWVLQPDAVGGAAALAPGAVWTVEIDWVDAGAPATAAGGLLFRELFPIESWPRGADCPFPTINDTAYALNRAHGVDTFFTEFTLDAHCNSTLTAVDIVNTLAPKYDFLVLPSAEPGGTPPGAITDDSHLVGWFLADEDDTVVDDKARTLLAGVVTARNAWPGLPTYAGGASNKYTGAYAGIADVKGMDAYIACCAPHYALLALPPRGSYDYLANTRANHAPGPTWLYTQGVSGGWDDDTFGLTKQVDPAELAVQIASVVAAGAKGLMIFQTDFYKHPGLPAYNTMRTLLREVGAMRELYRAGDATGAAAALVAGGAAAGDDIVVEAILGPRAIVVVAINARAAADNQYNDLTCLLGAPHWAFAPVALDAVAVALPAGFVVTDSFEVFNASVVAGALPIVPVPGARARIGIANVTLGTEGPGSANCTAPVTAITRTFVLAADAALRGELAAKLLATAPAPAVAPLAGVTGVGAGDVATPTAAATHNASWWLTSRDGGERLAPQPPMPFSATGSTLRDGASSADGSTLLVVDASSTFQTWWGFGAAITESSAHVFGQLDAATQASIIEDVWGENADGTSLRYTGGRLHIGSCDFALGYYNYNEHVNDTAMGNFSIAHDKAALIPLILRAQAAAAAQSRQLRFMAAPWSPPAWMKSNYPANNYTITGMSCFPLGPLDCSLLPEFQPAYAHYLSLYLTHYKAAGVNIYGLTPQNEPQAQDGTIGYEGLWLDPEHEFIFVAEYLGPRLRSEHPDVKIFLFDHNEQEAYFYVRDILEDPIAKQYADGVAFHWYEGPGTEALQQISAEFPTVPLFATEATVDRGDDGWFKTPGDDDNWAHGEYYMRAIIDDVNANVAAFIDWNFLLDQMGGPSHADYLGLECESDLNPCGSNAMLIADTTVTPAVVYRQAWYWFIAHSSRWVPPGSIRVATNVTRADGSPSPLRAMAFVPPGAPTATATTTLVVLNDGNTTEAMQLRDGRFGVARASIAAHSLHTFIY